MTTTEQMPLAPIAAPPPPDPRIGRMAQEGFKTYFTYRPYTWQQATFPVRRRWELMAERILERRITTAEELWRGYTDGLYGVPAFSGVHRLRWSAVLAAMKIAATAEAA